MVADPAAQVEAHRAHRAVPALFVQHVDLSATASYARVGDLWDGLGFGLLGFLEWGHALAVLVPLDFLEFLQGLDLLVLLPFV